MESPDVQKMPPAPGSGSVTDSRIPVTPGMSQVPGQEGGIEMANTPTALPTTTGETELGNVDLERDAENSGTALRLAEESTPQVEKTDTYMMTGKGHTPEQKVNESVKDLNYHNMVIIIAVGDKTIN